MRKIEIKGRKFDYDPSLNGVILKSDITSKILDAVRRYPKGGEGRNWKVILIHKGGTVWWVTDLNDEIRYTVQRHFHDRRNYVTEIEKYRVW